jgi:uncharacterized protein YggE
MKTIGLGCAIVLVWVARAGAVDDFKKPQRTVTVQGQGKVAAVPDVATLVVEATQEGAALDKVTVLVRQQMTKVLAAMKAQGVADRDLQTIAYQVQPKYEYDKNRNPKPSGYRVTNRLQVKVRDLEKVGKILSAAIDSGANNVVGPDFDVDNPRQLEREAQKLAVQEARARAELLAQTAGAALGSVQTIQPLDSPVWPMPKHGMVRAMSMAAVADSAPEPVAAGEQVITANVSVTFELK